jgi:sulfur carrier protein ThiS
MPAKLILRDKEYSAKPGCTIMYALVKAGIDVRVVRPTRNGEIIDLLDIIREDDVITLVALVSGG